MEEGLTSRGNLKDLRSEYEQSMFGIRTTFRDNLRRVTAGLAAVTSRSAAVDSLVRGLWSEIVRKGIPGDIRFCLVAVGGYGRGTLFPHSDIDLMFLVNRCASENDLRDPIQTLTQWLWDCGLRVAMVVRTLSEINSFDRRNLEFTLATFDSRFVVGDLGVFTSMKSKKLPHLYADKGIDIVGQLAEITKRRHERHANTLFHLEPNIKEFPGGLRDIHVCSWLSKIGNARETSKRELSSESVLSSPWAESLTQAHSFLVLVRVFLHFEYKRDHNVLDWQAQDLASYASLGLSEDSGNKVVDPSYWMRVYFRHARVISHTLEQTLEACYPNFKDTAPSKMTSLQLLNRERPSAFAEIFEISPDGIRLRSGASASADPSRDSESVFAIFRAVANTGFPLASETETRLTAALPYIAAQMENGRKLWQSIKQILLGRWAGKALRAMHALGFLELILPEFHGIDALVIRDAYHRYTVDEHTFVVIDIIHSFDHAEQEKPSALTSWKLKFRTIVRDLEQPGLLYLASLLHDTGKGYCASGHAVESTRLAQNVLKRLGLELYEESLVLGLIRNHLEMSKALRRDIYASETIEAFSRFVPTPEALKMLSIFTYADISAVHPDALTPWKAEKIFHLYLAVLQHLDRSVDKVESGTTAVIDAEDVVKTVGGLLPHRRRELDEFLSGLPQRYLLTRGVGEIRKHFDMADHLRHGLFHEVNQQLGSMPGASSHSEDAAVDFEYQASVNRLTLVSYDRPLLFAKIASALSSWGMNIVTAQAFSNSAGIVIDVFYFTDTYRTLELNESERQRFEEDTRRTVAGRTLANDFPVAGRRGRLGSKMTIDPRIHFDDLASASSTVLEVTAQDSPGLLRTLAVRLGRCNCSIEFALVDTEGDLAIDVFYIRRRGAKISPTDYEVLRHELIEAIQTNAD